MVEATMAEIVFKSFYFTNTQTHIPSHGSLTLPIFRACENKEQQGIDHNRPVSSPSGVQKHQYNEKP